MIKGITPIDTAFEIIGLCNAQQLTLYIFKETMCGALVFVVGFIFSLWASVSKGTFKPFAVFFVLFFSIWILFVVPSVPVPSVTSSMEQNGYQTITTQQLLNNNAQSFTNNTASSATINPILNIFSDMFGAFTIGAVGAIERGADPSKSNYLKNPFLISKLSVLANDVLSQGIKDPALRKEVTDFYKNDYLPALQKLIETRDYTVKDMPKLWPGDPAVTAVYTAQQTTDWNTVRADILTNIQNNSGFPNNQFLDALSKMTNKSSSVTEDQSIISIFSSDMKMHPAQYAYQSYQNAGYANTGSNNGAYSANWWGKVLTSSVATTGANIFQPIVGSISSAMLQMAPYIQGYSLMLMFSFFPFILVIAILERKPYLFVEFLKNLFWVKSWTICWAIVDVGSSYVLTVEQLFNNTDTGASGFWNGAYFNIVTAIFMIGLPILSRMMIDGVATGLGVAATAANLHADKSVDLGVRTTTGAIGKVGPVGRQVVDKIVSIRSGGTGK